MTIGESMRKARLKKGYSQPKLSMKTGLPVSTISFYETGRTFPGILNLIAIADALGITIDELVGRTTKK